MIYHGKCEMDSHADTIVAGKNCVVLNYTGKECDVSAFSDKCGTIENVPLARVATAWQSADTAQNYILVMNEALWMSDSMESTLINPNQLRHYGLHIQDALISTRPISMISEDTEFAMALEREDTILYFNTHDPTQQNLVTYHHIVISSKHSWNSMKVRFDENSHLLKEEVEWIRRVSYTHSKNKSFSQ